MQYLIYTDFYRRRHRDLEKKDKFKLLLNYHVHGGTEFMYVFRYSQFYKEKKGLIHRYWLKRYLHCCEKYLCDIPLEVQIGKGYAMFHANGIVLHGSTVLGDNVTILQQVAIGNGHDKNSVAHVGSDVFLGAGAKKVVA